MLGQTRIAWLKSGPSPIWPSRPRLSQLIPLHINYIIFHTVVFFYNGWISPPCLSLLLSHLKSTWATWSPTPRDVDNPTSWLDLLIFLFLLSCSIVTQYDREATWSSTLHNLQSKGSWKKRNSECGIWTANLPCRGVALLTAWPPWRPRTR